MEHGDGSFVSRFRPHYEIDTMPRVVGLCVTCRRTMWTKLPHGPHRPVAASGDGRHCEPCARYMRETGRDPRFKKGNPAERVPAEMSESDPSWRDDPTVMRCTDIGPEPFWPDPFTEELQEIPDADREVMLETRHDIAEKVCARCPVLQGCRRAATELGAEGLWGGRFYRRNSWVDLLHPEVFGPTVHTPNPRRVEMVARLRRRGLDESGEPLAAVAV